MNEIWKEIEILDKKYSVSTLGKVRNNSTGRILKQRLRKNGYMVISITYKNKPYWYSVHRLVLTTFCPTDNENLHVDHIDFNKLNNSLENLRWLDKIENAGRKNPNKKEIVSRKLYKHLLSKLGEQKLCLELEKLIKGLGQN